MTLFEIAFFQKNSVGTKGYKKTNFVTFFPWLTTLKLQWSYQYWYSHWLDIPIQIAHSYFVCITFVLACRQVGNTGTVLSLYAFRK